ncbi:MAG TPA: hypothetical protein VFY13_02980 [Luteolibacter sp.]|nr:hypothetical protein [Luteolibacter sp.]
MVRPLKEVLQGGVDPSLLELLEAVGFHDAEALAQADATALHGELLRANSMLKLSGQAPQLDQVRDCIGLARQRTSPVEPAQATPPEPKPQPESKAAASEGVAVDYERLEEVQAMMAASPYALPLPARLLAAHGIAVSSIPKGLLLSHHVGDLEVRVSQDAPMPSGSRDLQTHSREDHGADLDWSRLRAAGEVHQDEIEERQDPNLKRSPRGSTNAGKNPKSRWFIRGVLHPEPFALYLGALATLWIYLLLPCALVSATMLAFSSVDPQRYAWVPGWLVWVPAALLPSGIAYLALGVPGRCRVCSQKLFVHRTPHKHSKSHRLPGGFGHVVALCLHLLVFRWFRCTHCGTAVRIKE